MTNSKCNFVRGGRKTFSKLFVFLVVLIFPAIVFGQFVRFSDVSVSAGVSEPDSGTGHGVVFADFNGDGLLDIYMVNWWYQPNFLFINNGNGTFTNRAANFGVTVPDGGDRGVGAVDYDNDGDIDLYISAGGNNLFFRNDNNQHFTNVTYAAGVADWGQGMNACFGDYDRDGNVDLLITNQGTGWNQLFRNNGNGTFSKVTTQAGLGQFRYSNGAAFFDYDNDGYPDIFITRGTREQNYPSLLFHNNGNGTFIGSLIGAVLGSTIGRGRGSVLASLAGGLGGAYVGREVGKANAQELTVQPDDYNTEIIVIVKGTKHYVGEHVRIVKRGQKIVSVEEY